MITPANLIDQNFRYVRDSFGILSNIGCNLLPISLLSFEAEPFEDAILLDWKTASEEDNSHFEIEHSTDGFNFEALATVVGNGTTFTEQRYQHFHTQPAGGVNYYRLYQVDLDEKRNGPWYAIASLENEAFTLRAFPNPLLPHHRRWLVKVSGAANNDLTISLYGADGKLHWTESIFALENHLSFEFDRPASCTAGVYIVEVISGSRKLSRQLIFH